MISHNENYTFFDNVNNEGSDNEISELDEAQADETMDNDSDPSFKGGSHQAAGSKYFIGIFKFSRFKLN